MGAPALEFWFEFASTYSYPAAMRIERVANARGVARLPIQHLSHQGTVHVA
jgi:2-hydroxychromene-2-carboxylate isomerase